MLNPFERLSPLPPVEVLIDSVANKLGSINGKTVKEREIRRLKYFQDRVSLYNEFVKRFPRIDQLHPFYQTSLEIASGSLDKVRICLSKISRSSSVARSMLEKYQRLIRVSPEHRANSLMRAGFGRAASILREAKQCVDWISSVVVEVSKGKAIDPDLPTVIVAGPPNVGKSTLVSLISSAKPEVANYPFTTKEIHVGHMNCGAKVQVIDTPGILDRPDVERNVIERKAINALRNLRGVVVFLFDVSESANYTAEEQLNIYRSVSSLDKPIIVALNKVDNPDKALKEKILNSVNALEISCTIGQGITELKREIFKLLRTVIQDPSAVLDC
ncbi:GTP-binding protein [Metallosphaera tengchongensis]|uniref:GTP-binding protein n=1 Tax=Metallosphaera tengchongensis TaxID=1532350 RepID=A0A6N0NTY0_9CREN|nr:GTPase [Metallosphaera tengchongensis]QKQ99614.1 GTP-binding protein [Metallosphaera tengchongensis]